MSENALLLILDCSKWVILNPILTQWENFLPNLSIKLFKPLQDFGTCRVTQMFQLC